MCLGGGCTMTIGQMVRSFILKLDWYGTLFPRIPVPIHKELEASLQACNLNDDRKIYANEDDQQPEVEDEKPQGDGFSFGEAEKYAQKKRDERKHSPVYPDERPQHSEKYRHSDEEHRHRSDKEHHHRSEKEHHHRSEKEHHHRSEKEHHHRSDKEHHHRSDKERGSSSKPHGSHIDGYNKRDNRSKHENGYKSSDRSRDRSKDRTRDRERHRSRSKDRKRSRSKEKRR